MLCAAYPEWILAGLKSFEDFAEAIERRNQVESREGQLEGEWFFGDETALVIYWGTFGEGNSPGEPHYTHADKYQDREAFFTALYKWEILPEYASEPASEPPSEPWPHERKQFDDEWFISHDKLAVPSYWQDDGVASVNVYFLKDRDDCIVVHGDHYGRRAWLADTPANRELILGLDDYPLLSDEAHSEYEDQLHEESWTSWIRSDLIRGLPHYLRAIVDMEVLDAAAIRECYDEVRDNAPYSGHVESGSYTVPVKHWQEPFNEAVQRKLTSMFGPNFGAILEAAAEGDEVAQVACFDFLEDN